MLTPVNNDSQNGQFSTTSSPKSPILPCNAQANKNRPCDVARLQLQSGSIIAKAEWNLEKPVRQSDGRKKITNKKKLSLANQYDLILEIASPYPTASAFFEKDKVPKVVATSSYVPASCPVSLHALMELSYAGTYPTDSYNTPPGATQQHSTTITPIQVCGPPIAADSNNSSFWLTLISLFPKRDFARDVTVIADSCGVRLPDANGRLRGLLRVFRDDPISVEIVFPPMASGSQSQNRDGHSITSKSVGGSALTKSYDTDGKLTSMSASGTHDMALVKRTYTRSVGSNAKAVETTQAGVQVSIKRGGTELSISEIVNRWLAALEAIQKAIDKITDLLGSVPKLGYWIDGSWEILSGSVTGSWSPSRDAKQSSAEYQLLTYAGAIKFDLTVAKASFTIGAGLKADSPEVLDWLASLGTVKAYQIELSISLTVSGSIAVGTTINFGDEDEGGEKELAEGTGTYQWNASAKAIVVVMGVGGSAICSLTGGIVGKAWLKRYGTAEQADYDLEVRVDCLPLEVTLVLQSSFGKGDEEADYSPDFHFTILEKCAIYGDPDKTSSGIRVFGSDEASGGSTGTGASGSW